MPFLFKPPIEKNNRPKTGYHHENDISDKDEKMEIKNYTLSAFNNYAADGVAEALSDVIPLGKTPMFICIGSDLVLGDSLGPLVGTLLKKRSVSAYVYGTLNLPITAKEVEYAKTYLKQMHPSSVAVAIDAAVGSDDDVGLIKVVSRGLKPGLGVDKNLGLIGDLSIIGVVAAKSVKNYNLYNLTRLNLIYKMAEKITDGIESFINGRFGCDKIKTNA